MTAAEILSLSDAASAGPFLVSFDYKGTTRVVEPYSYKSLGEPEASLYAYQVEVVEKGKVVRKEKGHIQTFLFSGITNFQVLDRRFEPRNGWETKLEVYYRCSNCNFSRVRASMNSCPQCNAVFESR